MSLTLELTTQVFCHGHQSNSLNVDICILQSDNAMCYVRFFNI